MLILQGSEEIDRIVDFPDDAAAILGAHRVEHALASHLRQHVQYDRNVYRTMFEAAGPLESFEAKINIAFLFGLAAEDLAPSALAVRDVDYPLIVGACVHLHD